MTLSPPTVGVPNAARFENLRYHLNYARDEEDAGTFRTPAQALANWLNSNVRPDQRILFLTYQSPGSSGHYYFDVLVENVSGIEAGEAQDG